MSGIMISLLKNKKDTHVGRSNWTLQCQVTDFDILTRRAPELETIENFYANVFRYSWRYHV